MLSCKFTLNTFISFATILLCHVAKASQTQSDSSTDRKVTDLEVIYGSYGVDIEFWYNESSNANELNSVPGCPQSIDGIPWIYYGAPPNCFLSGTHGPCPFGERLLLQRDSGYGVCACECLVEYDNSDKLQGPDRYVGCMRKQSKIPPINEQIFDKVEKKCYLKYDKGPCLEKDAVITGYNSSSIECLPICNTEMEGWEEQVKNGRCQTLQYVLSNVQRIETNGCPEEDEVLSVVLKKCVKRLLAHQLVIG